MTPEVISERDPAAVLRTAASEPAKMVERLQQHDFSPLFVVIMSDLEEDHTEFFRGEHAPDGTPWAALADSTVRRKGHDTILRETGRLWGSVAADEPPHALRELIDEQLTKGFLFGTDHPAARLHDQGTKHMPARPFLGFTEQRKDEITRMVLDEAVRVMTGVQD
jgi:phage gpG-like protein